MTTKKTLIKVKKCLRYGTRESQDEMRSLYVCQDLEEQWEREPYPDWYRPTVCCAVSDSRTTLES